MIQRTEATNVTLFHEPADWVDMTRWHEEVTRIRRETPVLHVEAEGYEPYVALTRHADIFEVERNHDVWLNTPRSAMVPDEMWNFTQTVGMTPKALVHLDGAEHRDHRGVANDWFKPAATARWQKRIDAIGDEFVQRMRDLGGACDFAIDVAQPFTLRVIMEIYGVPQEDEAMMLELTQGVFGSSDPEFAKGGDDMLMSAFASVMSFVQYFNEMTTDRRACPRDDLGSVIANGTIGGEPMSDEHRLWYYIIVATAGHDTTSFALTGGLQAMLEDPEQFARLQADPSLVTNAAEESIRWTSPVRHMTRQSTQDTEIRGVHLPAGTRALLSYPSANRDEDVFVDADRFDIARADVDKLLSFGVGPHFCLGAHFARREIRTMLQRLATQLDHIELAGTPQQAQAHFVSGTKHLPIAYRFR